MEYILIAVSFGICFGLFTFLDERRKEMNRRMDRFSENLVQNANRINTLADKLEERRKAEKAIQTSVLALADEVVELAKSCETLGDATSKAVNQLREDVDKLSETVKTHDRAEQAVFDGMNSILNYTVDVARKAAADHAE